jgi:hypothetical protein
MKIELLYFDGCPSWEAALANLKAVVGTERAIALIQVETPEQAEAEQFSGSPTIRVDGRDLFPTEGENFSLACRLYQTPDGIAGVPTRGMIRSALSVTASR